MQPSILNLIERLGGGVSFVELCRDIDGFAGPRDCTLHPPVILWQGVSDAAISALDELQQTRQIVLVACSVLVYQLDGKTLHLPVAKRRDYVYKRPCWYPVALSTPAQLRTPGSPLRLARRTLGARDHASVPR